MKKSPHKVKREIRCQHCAICKYSNSVKHCPPCPFRPQETSLKEHKTFTEECYNHPECMESLKECCEKCERKEGEFAPYPMFPSCKNPNCPCHTSSLKDGYGTIPAETIKLNPKIFPPVPSLEWEEEFENKFSQAQFHSEEKCYCAELESFIHKVESNALARGREEGNKSCPPHNFIPYHFVGGWGGSVPPPNMKCTKCLSEQYF